MKVSLSGERNNFDMFSLGDEELFRYIDNHPYPELMGGKLADAWKRGTKKVKAKVQKAVKKAATKYKKLPKWAKVVTGVLGAPAVLGLAPAAIGAVAPIAAAGMATALPAAAAALPVAIPALQAKMIAKRRKQRLAAQSKIASQTPAPVQSVSEPVYQPEPVYQNQSYQQNDYDDQEQQEVTSSNKPEEKKGLPGWLLGAAALIPFFL
jgi:hypothetical protein